VSINAQCLPAQNLRARGRVGGFPVSPRRRPPRWLCAARAGLLATAGVATSEIVHITLAAVGLSAFFAAAPTAFTALRLAGAGYLVYLGVQAIRHRGRERVEQAGASGVSGRRA
jgi:hypothetical protein